MRKFWLALSAGNALFWGCLSYLVTGLVYVGIIFGVVAFFVTMITGGLCIAAGEADREYKDW